MNKLSKRQRNIQRLCDIIHKQLEMINKEPTPFFLVVAPTSNHKGDQLSNIRTLEERIALLKSIVRHLEQDHKWALQKQYADGNPDPSKEEDHY